MENKRITLEAFVAHRLSHSDLKTLYLSMAFAQYSYLCTPDYDEERLLEILSAEIKKNIRELQSITEQFPNNHTLIRIYNFFHTHYKLLLNVMEEQKKNEQDENKE